MKIVHLSTYDINGGAARAAYRLHTGLRCIGHDSSMFVAHCESRDPSVITFQPPMDFPIRVRRRLRSIQISRNFARYRSSRPAGSELFSDDRTPHGTAPLRQLPSCDVINLHWINKFIDYQSFFTTVPRYTPVVLTLHDMNFFTGGCHYDHGCGGFRQRCGSCPQLGSHTEDDLSRQVWRRKHDVLGTIGEERLQVVANSHWLAHEAHNSSLLSKFPVTTIHFGLDTDTFAPRNRHFARDVLGVPQDAKVVLFVAHAVNARRKGFALLAQALNGLDDLPGLFLISLGHGKSAIDARFPHLLLGQIDNDCFLSLIYSAADVFVIPSLQEAFGQTALESLACGTPVVGFAVGGIPDIVHHGISGLLVPPEDVDALRTAIVDLLQDPAKRAEMSINGRRIAEERHSLEAQARHYVDLYEKLVGKSENVT